MRKALVTYWVAMVTGVAILFCAVTVIMRLFPSATVSLAGGHPVIFGVSAAV